MALKRRKVKDSEETPAKKKATFKRAKKVVEKKEVIHRDDDFDDEEENGFDDSEDGFDDMEEIPLDISHATPIAKKTSELKTKPLTKTETEKVNQGDASKIKAKKILQKPPTSQEMNALRETENLFHSNIFKLQVEEMLTEISMKSKRKKQIEDWIVEFEEVVNKIPESGSHSISDTAWLNKLKVKCPFGSDCYDSSKTFQYLKPKKLAPIGSWAIGLTGKGISVDILVEIPQESLERDDYLNYTYHRKRALYLSYVAAHLQKASTLVQEIQFETFSGDLSRPILRIEPTGKLNQRVFFRIFASAPADLVAVEKLLPDRNCIPGTGVKKSDSKPTPLYNASVLSDMRMSKINQHAKEVLSSKKNILDACLLLRVWLRHRQLEETTSMFLLTQFVVYLIETKKLFPNMSVYQVVRTIWLQLSRSNWSKEGITLRPQSGTPPLSVADAHASFPVIFLDVTSTLNLCAHLSQAAYDWLRWECTLAVGLLNKKGINSFAALFITPKPFLLTFDNVVIIDNIRAKVQKDKRQLYWPVEAAGKIHECLVKGLDERLKLTACKTLPIASWSVGVEPPKNSWKLAFGLCFNSPAAWEVLNKGPAANTPESAEFRAFWGEKSELRRFQDGFICEAVHWPAKNWAERRLICRQIVSYLLEKRLNLANNYVYVADQLESAISIPKLQDPAAYGTGEESTMAALEALDEMTKNLRALEDLPLSIAQVQGVSSTFRHAEPFPPLPETPQGKIALFGRSGYNLLPSADATPIYLPSLSVLLTLQTSGKWPDDLEAVRRIKAAFYIQLAEKLTAIFDLVARAFIDHVIVERKGYIFKLVIAYHRDVALLKRLVEPNGIVKYRDNPESLLLQRDQEITPKLATALRALQAEQPSYSAAVRLAKRWIASHMLLEYLEEEAVEMIVASLFIDSTMYGVPSAKEVGAQSSPSDAVDWVGPLSPQVAFFRFLQLVACYDWSSQPLIINFNNDLTPEEIRDIETSVAAQRSQLKSPLVLVTPYDPSGVAFTRSTPPLPVWSRLMILARESLKLLEQQLMTVDAKTVDVLQAFRPPLDAYNCIIHLNKGAIARRLHTLDGPSDKKVKLHEQRPRKTLSIYDYEPVDRLLSELRAAYADKARFFYDKYGGLLIGVMWIDKAWSTPSEFKVSHVNGSMLVAPSVAGGEKRLAPNLEAICQDFLIMGKGLVKSVQTGTLLFQDAV
ncbi:nucleolar protein 6-like [Daphnia carinata]|uniref:nucleolar protein 6-like n=1 Tax=Daphnia carinata TaxID=120202 RepID=UPI0025802F14|nr:nucleolar protein 6-like [Daphnia carinata]